MQTIRRELEGKMYNEIKHRREVEEHMEKLNIQLNTANQCIKQLVCLRYTITCIITSFLVSLHRKTVKIK